MKDTESTERALPATTLGQVITPADIVEAFAFFEDWEDRYAYILDLGAKHPVFPDNQKTVENIVKGCQSQVWLTWKLADDQLIFYATSDAHIVRGLLAIILTAANYRSPQELASYNFDEYLSRLALGQHLSPTRSNGLASMVTRIKTVANALQHSTTLDK